ncbi:Ig-like domain-containing protein [Geomobilimonas luticola]|uniref:Ig-like domain-containing protein n=1 Tax=Geomobilimonas luticola TaxID=1114878 RepID=UPI001BDA0086
MYSDPSTVTVTFTDKQTPPRFTATVTFSVAGKTSYNYNSTVKKTITIKNLTSAELDFHLFSYSDLDISSGGISDNVAIVKGERAIQTGFDPASGAAVGQTLIQTSTLKPSAYSIDTLSFNPGSIMESLDKSGPTQLFNDGGPNFENTDMQYAFQFDLKIPASGTSAPFDITKKMVETKPLHVTYAQAGESCASYGGNATFQLCADNTANTVAANNVVISQPLDPGVAGNNLTFAGATDGGSYDPATNSVNWTIPVLAAGATKCVQSTLTINSAVDFSTGAMAYSDETFPARYFKTDASGNPIKDINGVIDYNLLTGLCNYPPQITSIAPSTAVTGVPYRYQITASDAETDPLSYTLVQAPAGMTMSATGLISWAPTYDQKNTSFPVTVDVSDGTSVIHYTFSIYVNWQNMVPTAPVMQTANAVVTQPLSYQVLASDPDDQPLTYTTADPLPAGLALSTTGLLSGTPTAAGLYVVNVKVTDTWNASVTAPVVVDIKTVVILPPTMTAIPNATITAPAPFSYQVVASDPQNQSLAYTLAGNPGGMTISATGLIGWTPSVAGTSTITATATNTSGVSTSRTFTLTVNPEIKPPTVTPIPKTTITAPAALSYQVAATDPQGQALTYTLPVAPAGMTVSGAGLITWAPSVAGNYNVTVRVTNTSGRYTDSSFTLTVNAAPQAPTMNAIPNAAVTAPAVFTYQVAASDPQNQPLAYTLAGNPAGMTITTSGLINWPTSVAGVYAITVTATNTSNLSASRTFTLTVATGNRPPSVTAAGITTAEDTASAPVTPSVTDPDAGDTHTFAIVTQPANGTATVAANRLVYTPFANFNGNDSFTYRATDAGGLSVVGTASVTVTPVNDAPVLAAIANQSLTEDTVKTVPLSATDADGDTISYSVTVGSAATVAASISGSTLTLTPAANYNTTTPTSFTVTASDGKGGTSSTTFTATVAAVNDVPVANGQSVTVTEDTARAIVLAGSDADNDLLTYAVATQPTKGVLSGTAPNLTYTPSANATGADSFTFTVNDGTATSTAATVSITITAVNDAPVALNGTLSATEDTVATGTLSATDADNTSRTYSIVAQGTKGTVTITNAATGAYTYTPATNQNGADSFTFKANDGSLDSNAATVTVTIAAVNDVPTATTQSVSTTRNTAKTITLAGTDVEGSALTYTIVSQPAHGTLAGIAPNLTYTPTTNYTGADSFTFTVSDGTATSTIATVNITVTFSNVAPVATPQSVTTNEDTARAITLAGTDSDNDPLTYAVVTQPTKGVLSGTAPNLTYTPSANITGADSFTFTVSDGTATSTAAVSITITAVNDAPVLAAIANQSLTEDTVKTVPLSATDADGDTVSYSVTGGSAATVAASISGSTLTLTPAADYNTTTPISFTVTASDGKGGSGSRSFTAAVAAVNDVPVAAGQSVSTNRNAAKAIVLTGSDVEGSALTYAIVSPPANGTLSGAAPNLIYTPAANYTGSDSFTFTVSDGTAISTAATVSISVSFSNVAPVATPQSVAVTEDTARAIVLAGTDADNDPLTYTVATQPAKGVLSGTAPNLTYTPIANATGADSFTFTVSDGAVTSAAVTVSITIAGVNDAPVVTNPGAQTSAEGATVSLPIAATDADGNTLSYSATGLPAGLSINSASGVISGTLGYAAAGSYNATVTVTDGTAPVNVSFIWTVTDVDRAPTITNPGNQSSAEGAVVNLNIVASDPDGTAVSYTATGLPAGLAINTTTGAVTGTVAFGAAATNTVTVTVTSNGKTAQTTFTWTVVATPKLNPVITWANPADISYDTLLSSTQLNATADVAGIFSYTPAPGTRLNAGNAQTLTAMFTPADTAKYTTVTKSVTVNVLKASATVTLSGLNATYDGKAKAVTAATNPAGLPVSITYDGSSLVPTTAGSYAVVATVTDSNYAGSAGATLVIAKATPVVTWATPPPVVVGTALSATQLDASANVTGAFTYAPVAGTVMNTAGSQSLSVLFMPTDTINYTAATATVALTVNAVSNQPPAMNGIPSASVTSPAAFTCQVVASDPEGQPLTYTLTGNPAGMTISSTGAISWPNSVTGTYTITATATDQGGLSSSRSFTLTVTAATSQVPVITSVPITTATVDKTYSYNVDAVDPNGKSLYYSLGDHPDEMEIDHSTGLLTWKPSRTGTYKVTVQVRNSNYYRATQTFAITVTEGSSSTATHTLKITSTPVTTAYKGKPYVYEVKAADSLGHPLTYSLSTAPDGMKISSNGVISWTPSYSQYGTYSVTVRGSDGTLTTRQSFSISVRSSYYQALSH